MVQQLMEKTGVKRVYLEPPVKIEGADKYLTTYVLMTQGHNDFKKLVILIQDEGMRPGSWTADINGSLFESSMYQWAEAAKDFQFSLLVLNPNDNTIRKTDTPIPGSETPEKHAEYAWNTMVVENFNVREVAIVTHRNGCKLALHLSTNGKRFTELVTQIAFIDSNDIKECQMNLPHIRFYERKCAHKSGNCEMVKTEKPESMPYLATAKILTILGYNPDECGVGNNLHACGIDVTRK